MSQGDQSINNQNNHLKDNIGTALGNDQELLDYKDAEQNGLFDNLPNIQNNNYLDKFEIFSISFFSICPFIHTL